MASWVSLGLLVLAFAPQDKKGRESSANAADAITLRDGKVLRGQVVDPSPPGKMIVVARRAWVREHLAPRSKRWEAAEKPAVAKALAFRRDRLRAWRSERVVPPGREDTILTWIDGELKRLDGPGDSEPSRLMAVTLGRAEVTSVARRTRPTGRLLRLGWRVGLADVETMPLKDLRSALGARGYSAEGTDPAAVDDLLPPAFETDARWLLRRAATEVHQEAGLRFIRYQNLVLPEGQEAAPDGAAGAALGALKELLGEQRDDPLLPRLREAESRGRVGLVVTRLDMEPDFSQVRVESTFWVRSGRDRWQPAIARPAVARPEDVRPEAGEAIAADPRVDAVFRAVEALGLGQADPGLKKRALTIGAATRKALQTAQATLASDLETLALPITEDAVEPKAKSGDAENAPAPKP